MPMRFSIASDPTQIDAVLKLRYEVFQIEGRHYKPIDDQRILDRFDTFSTTRNIVAIADGQLVGSMRVTLDSSAGFPADEYYDFRRFLPDGAWAMNVSMYCVRAGFRGIHIPLSLFMMAVYYAISRGVTHLVAPINPPIAKLVSRMGFKHLEGEQFAGHLGRPFIPTMLDVKELQDLFVAFAQRNNLYNFLQSYDCIFYKKGEVVFTAGDVGDSAFVIVEGEVEVRRPGSDQVLDVMGEGEIFGELALLTDDVRAADVVAKTDLRTMVLPKDAFMKHLRSQPDDAVKMLRSIGARMKNVFMKTRV